MQNRKKIAKQIGKKIRILRHKLNLSGIEMANLLYVSQQQLSRYERGINLITLDKLVFLANFAQCSLDWLCSEKDENNNHSFILKKERNPYIII